MYTCVHRSSLKGYVQRSIKKHSAKEQLNKKVVAKISRRSGLGAEHPRCDQVQLIMLILFFVVWGIDTLSFFIFGYSTVFGGLTLLPLRLLLTVASIVFGGYLVTKSHKAVFEEMQDQSRLIDSSVYSWVRHPMYLGILLSCLGFFFGMPSLTSLVIWFAFFIFYDRMATYEEKDLIRIFGEQYINYQKRVPKWFPRPRLRTSPVSED